jgi:aminopeptidase N
MARANLTSYVSAMELTRYLTNEHDYAPWTAASVALDYIDVMFYGLLDEKDWKVCFIIIWNFKIPAFTAD